MIIIKIMNNNDYNRLLNQAVEILIYDYSNKYQVLKEEGLSKDKITAIMSDYQKNRSKEFVANYSIIKNFYNYQ